MRRASRALASLGLAVATVFAPVRSYAEEEADRSPAAAATQPCADVQTQLELTACWRAAALASEKKLAQELAETDAALRKRGRKDLAALLRASQARWEPYRDAECKLGQQVYGGGSAAGMAGSVCRWRLATARTEEVRTDREAVEQ